MAIINIQDAKGLAEYEDQLIVSIYMPAHRGKEGQQDPIRLKNCLNSAREQVKASAPRAGDLEPALERAAGLVENHGFWRRQSDGIAIFMGKDLYRVYRAPIPFDEITCVGRTAQVLPLLSAMDEGTEFYVLAATKDHVRLLQGSRSAMAEIELPGGEHDIGELLGFWEDEAELQFRSIHLGTAAGDAAMFHGHGDSQGTAVERQLKFFRAVDEEVRRALRGKKAPLIFAGDASVFARYKEASEFPLLSERFVRGNPEPLSLEKLHEQSWPLVRDQLTQNRKQRIADLKNSIVHDRGSTQIASIVHAAMQGRVDHLLVANGRLTWGRYNVENNQVQVLPERQNGAEDLQNLAAVHTLRNGGAVSVISAEEFPFDTAAAAQFRF